MALDHSLQGKHICVKTGAMLGLGIHGINMMRHIALEEPVVTSATSQSSKGDAGVDSKMECELSFPGGGSGHLSCSAIPSKLKKPTTITIHGSSGNIFVTEWFEGGKEIHEINRVSYE